MASTTESTRNSTRTGNLAMLSRVILLACAALFAGGAMGQFFLAGLSVFDGPAHWADHANLGHAIGIIGRIIWLPAAVGRVGGKLIAGALLLAVLFEAQYAFIGVREPYVQALHPLNGALMLALSLWITRRVLDILRHGSGS